MINEKKEYRFSLVMVSKTGNYIMDIGKFYGGPEVFNAVMENMNEDDLVTISRIFQAKVGKITTKEIDKHTTIGSLNCMIGSKIIKKFMEERNNVMLDEEASKGLNSLLNNDAVEHIRIVLTFSANNGCGDMFILGDDEPLNPSTIFGRVYDNKRKKFKDATMI